MVSPTYPAPRLLDRVSDRMRIRSYSPSTIASYCHWIRQYILFNGKRHPTEMGRLEIEAFLSHLASDRHVSPSTQNQALSALLYLYTAVLEMPLEGSIDAVRAKRPKHIPTVLSQLEIQRLLDGMTGSPKLVVQLLYGSGLRVQEALTLRVHQLDFANGWINVIGGKGSKDRITLLPKSAVAPLEAHLRRVKHLHDRDLSIGLGAVILPHAFHLKDPSATHDFRWQFVFPSTRTFDDAKTGFSGRWHLNPSTVRRELSKAASEAGIHKRVSPHVLRHCFATHLMESGCDIRLIQALLGHKSVTTTMIYAHLVESRRRLLDSPLDAISYSASPPQGGA